MSSIRLLPADGLAQPVGGTIVALHCSGGSGDQWRKLAQAAGERFAFRTPDLYGCGCAGAWSGQGAFALADEALATIAAIDETDGPVHLVGHSYGGAVALHAALRRTDRIASVALYEPTLFHLLPHLGREGSDAYAEIGAVAGSVAEGVISGDYRGAAARFVDYWSGEGSWDRLKPEVQTEIARWIVKAPLDFRALFRDPTPLIAYAALRCPLLVLRGEHAPAPTRLAGALLAQVAPLGRNAVIPGAGHMGPITHAAEVNGRILEHIQRAQQTHRPWRAAG
jgi:pimeloyl-ACP methyl ester carboxylesterase